ncbi:MAG TPA: toxin-antitoxin system YwqK family antitoxin [Spirochaetota bacterium]|nr:toxin-antitoxin system YwqK family antitoxin [Spirochaetota bacterium]HOD14682.1 toxin-antitoxin system YwqK family antitoxin [Spirochaetota bacterium]HPG49157.1 toxin-antitoxin system YwqK family antitoxin [Spirochaetota bacterium]HPN11192.1 toxin-antitoxin system YwqK family antitoxin [Spirochaetota bacterium]HQL81145.1 toxin-antitoxin system YwqK family antitoxin [Spirochaetota bacterium]
MSRWAATAVMIILFPFMYGGEESDVFGRPMRVASSVDGGGSQDNNPNRQPEVVKEYYASGKVKSETSYVDGKIHGKRKLYYENGNLQKEEEYSAGIRAGVFLEYYEDGALRNYETYRDDALNGVCYMQYPGGQKMMIGQCANGKKTGKWTLFHKNGEKYMEGNFIDNLMEGLWRSYSPDGDLDSEGEYSRGSQAGLWIYYDKSRKIEKKLTLKDGVVEGECWIYRNGKLVGEGIMAGQTHDPVINGSWKAYYKNGHLEYEGVFTMGKKNGEFKEYYSNGNLKATGEYLNDQRNGSWIFYDDDGKTVDQEKSGLYQMGKLNKQNNSRIRMPKGCWYRELASGKSR